jgi:putative DNA primase/helicase
VYLEARCNYTHIQEEKLKKMEEIAIKAAKLFDSYSNSGQSNYLKNKNIDDISISDIKYVSESNIIVVPLKDKDNKIWSLQYICENGNKNFLKDGKKQGNFFLINNNDGNLDNKHKEIYLAEGFATAVTIHKATNKAVAVCFDAGNIEPVLKNLQSKYPNKEFIVAADNDLWKETNTGREKAEMAASKYNNTKVILPEFKYEHKDHLPTDFNDLEKLEGIEEVKKQLVKSLSYNLDKNHILNNNKVSDNQLNIS